VPRTPWPKPAQRTVFSVITVLARCHPRAVHCGPAAEPGITSPEMPCALPRRSYYTFAVGSLGGPEPGSATCTLGRQALGSVGAP
jgi:hypothetical protein